jgi:pimeloyl-ACP methyl ester carboxylesterase
VGAHLLPFCPLFTYASRSLRQQDHVGWSAPAQVHVAGFSMGGMVAAKLAVAAPQRVASLALLSVTGE